MFHYWQYGVADQWQLDVCMKSYFYEYKKLHLSIVGAR